MIPSFALLLLLVYGCYIALAQTFSWALFLPLLALCYVKKESLLPALKLLFFANLMVGIIVATLVFQEKYTLAFLVAVRSNCLIFFTLLLFSQENPTYIARGFQHLGVPDKIVTVVFFTAKFIGVLHNELQQFKRTTKIRGFIPRTTLLTYKTIAGGVGILILKALERSFRLEQAMTVRGFTGKIHSLTSAPSPSLVEYLLLFITLFAAMLHFWEIL